VNPVSVKPSENLDADIVIIGGGGAGLTAAISASEKGCTKIIILEKVGSTGGNSAMAHDLFGVESPVQKRMGVDARRDDFFKVAMRWCHWSEVNPRIIRAFIDKSGDTIQWLLEKRITFQLGQYYINQSPRVRHTIDGRGAELMRVLARECKKRGIEIRTHTPAKKITCAKNGQVIGVLAVGPDNELNITTKSVIIATGGYAGNKEMLTKYCAYYNPDVMLNHGVRHNTGDGIQMATDIGAATAGLGHIMFHGPHAPSFAMPAGNIIINPGPNETYVRISDVAWEPETLWVNKRGRRYHDEGFNLSSFASATVTAQQPDGIMFCLFDESIKQNIEEQGLRRLAAYGGMQMRKGSIGAWTPLPGLGKGLKEIATKHSNWIKISDNWLEIANWIGANPEMLKKTIEEYNSACDKGFDPTFCKDKRYLLPLRTPPYYAILAQAMICDAIGGVKINENMEVVKANDDPIPGLFAAGSTTGCWESDNYCYELTGHLLGFALNSGRIAGENAVKYLSSKGC
jgi:fumarate reductase flavoprotein subunit